MLHCIDLFEVVFGVQGAMAGQLTGAVRWVLRIEGVCVLVAAMLFYNAMGFSWSIFAVCFFVPDISFFGYLAGARTGAFIYNVAHSYIGALVCVVAGQLLTQPVLFCAGIIWCAHIGFDRALGYGLKYSEGFNVTHLGIIGRLDRSSVSSLRRDE